MTEQYYGTGRRKTSIARVYLTPGTGTIIVNNKDINQYFGRKKNITEALSPFHTVEKLADFDAKITVAGGGHTGQSGAISLGISRALLEFDAELRPSLKERGHLTRDPREVERQKYGQKGARAKYQFSKR